MPTTQACTRTTSSPGPWSSRRHAVPSTFATWRQWWRWEPGASWRHPFGPTSSIDDRLDHPVVQVAYPDAVAYAAWAGRRLPTEAEWEWAARGGLVGARFAWGEDTKLDGTLMADTWQGAFRTGTMAPTGGSAPLRWPSFPANGYGLHDMIGNVWEWTADYWTHRHVPPGAVGVEAGHRASLLSSEPGSPIPRRVLKGGSHLCAPEYCLRYPALRRDRRRQRTPP
ncbi:SUMF1/EgtB/PvdO family nonheme iron enzyme [Microbacterium sp. NRRL B-14842]